MKPSKTAEENIKLERKRSIKIKFIRFGKKDKPYTQELFWLSKSRAYTLNDLKTIAIEAENLLKKINESAG